MLSLLLLERKDSAGRNLYLVQEDYRYTVGINTVITVPAGYITNFGTVPRWAYWFVSPEELREASVVHDFLTNENFILDGEPFYSGFSRRVADAILYEHMRKIGIDRVRSYVVYAGVRAWAYLTGNL